MILVHVYDITESENGPFRTAAARMHPQQPGRVNSTTPLVLIHERSGCARLVAYETPLARIQPPLRGASGVTCDVLSPRQRRAQARRFCV